MQLKQNLSRRISRNRIHPSLSKKKDLAVRKHYQAQTPLMATHKGTSVVILNQGVIVFEATARVAPEKQTESLPADALSHDS